MFKYSISLLNFNLVALSMLKSVVLKSQQLLLNYLFLPSVPSTSFHSIYFGVHFLGPFVYNYFIFLIYGLFYHYKMSPFTWSNIFILNSILSFIDIIILAILWLLFAGIYFFPSFYFQPLCMFEYKAYHL